MAPGSARERLAGLPRTLAVGVERWWDGGRTRRSPRRRPRSFRIEPYLGYGSTDRFVLRGRVLDDPHPTAAVPGESTLAAVRRTVSRFVTDELPDVPLRVRVAGATVSTRSDAEGYFEAAAAADLPAGPWVDAEVELAAAYRGLGGTHTAPARIRVVGPDATHVVVSDVDDTILHTGAQQATRMIARTLTGSALTRRTFPGAAQLYRALAGPTDANPVFYVSSSPWNLYDLLVAFLGHRGFPAGPLMLRDLLGDGGRRDHASHKRARIEEILATHPDLPLVLLGDTGQQDPQVYAAVARSHPGRVAAVLLREVRTDPRDGRVEAALGLAAGVLGTEATSEVIVSPGSAPGVPVVVTADSLAMARHAAGLGLLTDEQVRSVERASKGPGHPGGPVVAD